MKKLSSSLFLFFALIGFLTGQSQQYTENFNSTPTFTAYPGVPSWIQTATVMLGGTSYQFITAGNGGWEYKTNGGVSNSASLLYSTAATTNVRIQRTDGKRFQFYGVWLKYTNFTTGLYMAPWLRVTYDGSDLNEETYGSNTTVTLSKDVNVTGVMLYFNGLHDLNFDNVIVGPPTPIAPIPTTNEISIFSDNAAKMSGSVTDDGGGTVTESGLVYGTSAAPTIANNKTPLSSGMNSFSDSVTGLLKSTTYYVRSYAINSVGTSYGNEISFTTYGTFQMEGTHDFNSDWATTYSQPSPFTKYVEGWDVTGASSGTSPISISKQPGASGDEGDAAMSVAIDSYEESLMYLAMKPHTANVFNLKSFVFRYDVQIPGTYFGTVRIIGYKNGVPVAGATQAISNIYPYSTQDASYHTFTANNNAFDNVDEFRITVEDPVDGAMAYDIDIDNVITTANGTLPITFSSVNAYLKNSGVQVNWNVTAESEVDHYEIEKSPDGRLFVKAATFSPKGNNRSDVSYSWYDPNINSGNNYYRIKSVYITGSVKNSQILNVIFGSEKGGIKIYPNPVIGSSINLQINKQPEGNYSVQIFDDSGKLMFTKKVHHLGGSSTQSIEFNSYLGKGIYQIRIKGSSVELVQILIKN